MWFQDLLATKKSSWWVYVATWYLQPPKLCNLIEPEGSPMFFKEETSKPNQTLHFFGWFFPKCDLFYALPQMDFSRPQKNGLHGTNFEFLKTASWSEATKSWSRQGGWPMSMVSCHCYDKWFYMYNRFVYIYTIQCLYIVCIIHIYTHIYIYMYSYDPLNLTFHLKISGTRSTSSLLSSRIDLRFRCTSSKCFATAEISTTLQCRNTTTFELWIWDNHEISLGFLTSFTSKFEKIRKFIVCQMCDTWSFRTSSKKFEDGTCGTTWRSCKMENYSIAFICKSTSIEVNTFIAN